MFTLSKYKLWHKLQGNRRIQTNVLFEDNHIIVVDKPANLLVQGDSSNDTNLLDSIKHYLADKYSKEGNVFLGLVHRIDRLCSGVIVFARTSKAASRLSCAFKEREVLKKYICIVNGHLKGSNYCADGLIVPKENKKVLVSLAKSVDKTVEARLTYRSLLAFYESTGNNVSYNSNNCFSIVQVDLYTGRKHQIRAQLSNLGHPIYGDVKYGGQIWQVACQNRDIVDNNHNYKCNNVGLRNNKSGILQQQYNSQKHSDAIALHAYSLTIPHPITKIPMQFLSAGGSNGQQIVPDMWAKRFGSNIIDKLVDILKQQQSVI